LETVSGLAWRATLRGARVTVLADDVEALVPARAASTTASCGDSVTGDAASAPLVPPPVLSQSAPAAREATATATGAAARVSPKRLRPSGAGALGGVGMFIGNAPS